MPVEGYSHFEGGKELNDALEEMKHTLEAPTMRRGLLEALQPVADVAKGLAPYSTAPDRKGPHLRDQIKVGTRTAAKWRGGIEKSQVEVYMGPAPGSAKATAQEFGSYKMAAHPYMRPAWQNQQDALLGRVRTFMWAEIAKTAARQARRFDRLMRGFANVAD